VRANHYVGFKSFKPFNRFTPFKTFWELNWLTLVPTYRSLFEMSCRCETTVVGSSCSWQSKFCVEKMKSEKRGAAHRELIF
jgi:hypothetical protein